ncbi:hypothetical protein HYPSUDRAFT_197005 [Hypholoma sublateritium FD-334 SS-4]|uniref:DUF6533 domain-containing protein n=1 Tax=Hypholoma sublateritium (strain FD-334 SS-4) TaxID=945553 RepID=A0A0D2LLK4_HYPSF|nr:hypothetical protein HYPSUDRAFT_197005 [Hypholoma sublateritium FD-334 SS-4]
MESPPAIVTLYTHLMGNYKFQTSNYVLYLYDHLLTLPEEVERVWSQPLTFASLLFYINRYITHCQFIILQVEFYETKWPISFAGGATLSLVVVAELILILRIYGLYLGNKYILGFLLCLLSGQIIVMGWAIHFGIRAPLPPGFPGCVLTGSNNWFAGFWAAPLITDSCIFILTLWRTLRYQRLHGSTTTIKTILRDGTIYFFAIFSLNLMNTLIFSLAVSDLKGVGASFSQIMTSILISRLQLNLKKRPAEISPQLPGIPGSRTNTYVNSYSKNRGSKQQSQESTSFFTIGNLGQEVDDNDDFIATIIEESHAEDEIELFPPVHDAHDQKLQSHLAI